MVFDQDSLNAAVQRALGAPGAVPDGHKAALLTAVDSSGISVVAAAKIGDHWGIQSSVEHPWAGSLQGGVSIRATW